MVYLSVGTWGDAFAAFEQNNETQQSFKENACTTAGGTVVNDQCVTSQCTYQRYSCDTRQLLSDRAARRKEAWGSI